MLPPKDFNAMKDDPQHALFYCLYVMFACSLFSFLYVNVSSSGGTDIAKMIVDQDMYVEGTEEEEAIQDNLQKNINVAAVFGGLVTAILSIFADFMGAIGSGAGILMATTIVAGYFKQIKEEKATRATFIF